MVNLYKGYVDVSFTIISIFLYVWMFSKKTKVGRKRSLTFPEHTEEEHSIILNKSHLVVKYSKYKSNIHINLSITPIRHNSNSAFFIKTRPLPNWCVFLGKDGIKGCINSI